MLVRQDLVFPKQEKTRKKFIFINYLKALSILYVVGYWHLFEYTDAFPGYYNYYTKAITEIALGLFVLISGFLAGKSSQKSTGISSFYMKRLIRIYPLYFIAIFLFYIFRIDSSLTLLKSLAFVSMIHTPAPLTLWFINMIMLFYLITPFLSKSAKNSDLRKYCSHIALVVVLLLGFHFITRTLDGRLLMYLPCFGIGLYCSINRIKNTFITGKYLAFILIIVYLVYSALVVKNTTAQLADVYNIIQNPVISSLIKTPFVLLCSYLVFMLSYQAQDIFVNLKSIEFISYSSYAMYLFHRPIYILLKFLYFPANSIFQILYLMSFCLVITIFVSWGIQQLYDSLCRTHLRPFLN